MPHCFFLRFEQFKVTWVSFQSMPKALAILIVMRFGRMRHQRRMQVATEYGHAVALCFGQMNKKLQGVGLNLLLFAVRQVGQHGLQAVIEALSEYGFAARINEDGALLPFGAARNDFLSQMSSFTR